jgi:hypothetical protein
MLKKTFWPIIPPCFTYFYMETFFVIYDMLKNLQKECIAFSDSYANTCMNFGILLNKFWLIEISCSNLYFMNIFLNNLKENCKKIWKYAK